MRLSKMERLLAVLAQLLHSRQPISCRGLAMMIAMNLLNAAHSLLFTAAVRLVFSQTQEVEALPLLFMAASYLNALHKELGEQTVTAQPASTRSPILGGGLIAPALLDTLSEQLEAQDLIGAFSTARRYIQLGHDARSLFAVIGLASARADAAADQGHTMQIVQAAGEEYIGWPSGPRRYQHRGLYTCGLACYRLCPTQFIG